MSDKTPKSPKKARKSANGNTPQGGPALKKPKPKTETAAEGIPEEVMAVAAKPHSVGKTLRRAREEMKLSLEDVSAAINVRVVQLQSIEDDRIDQLPGMTYAVGFVKSYADFVKLDPQQVVHDFKAEHDGEAAAKTQLKIPEPISEDSLPGPVLIGIAALAVVVVFILWSVFAGGDDVDIESVASNIPPAPVVGTASGQPTLADNQPLTATTAEAANIAAALPPATEPDASVQNNILAATGNTIETTDAGAASATIGSPAEAQAVVVPPVAAPPPVPVPVPQPVINVRRGKTRVLLEAREKSWVQVSDDSGKVVYKKVMDKGEQFYVPDQKGMTLVTSNAGGLTVYVDGNKVQPIGREGEVMRGVDLSPNDLKKQRIRMGR